jgi:transposase
VNERESASAIILGLVYAIGCKTDPLDAAVLSACGQALQPKPTASRTQLEQQLAQLVRRRGQVMEILVAQRQQVERLAMPVLRRQAKSLVRRLESDLAQKLKNNSKPCARKRAP